MEDKIQKYWEKRGYCLVNTHLFPDRNFGWHYPDGTVHKDLPLYKERRKKVRDGSN